MGCSGSSNSEEKSSILIDKDGKLKPNKWREQAESLELECYLSFGLKKSQLKRKYVSITVCG